MNAKDKVEVLRQQVNALLSIERDLMQERQAQHEHGVNEDGAVERGKPPKSETQHSSISGDSHRRKNGTSANGA
jgi:hypothetical protein